MSSRTSWPDSLCFSCLLSQWSFQFDHHLIRDRTLQQAYFVVRVVDWMKITETSLFIRRLSENWKHNSWYIKENTDFTRLDTRQSLSANFVVCQQLLLATLGSKLQLNDNLKFPTWIKDCHKPARHRDNKVGRCLMLAGVATLQQRQMAGLMSRYFGGNTPGDNVSERAQWDIQHTADKVR